MVSGEIGDNMAINETFNPKWGTNEPVVTGASASIEKGKGSKSILATNTGTVTVYFRCGDSAVTASAADYPVLAGSQITITKFQDDTHLATYSALAGAVEVMAGEGF